MKCTKEKIMDAAVIEFAENGYKRTTVRAICNRANVNVASVNYHFVSKQDLYFQIFETYLPRKSELELPNGDNIKSQKDLQDTVKNLIRTLLDRAIDSNLESMKLFMRIAISEMLTPSDVRPMLFDNYVFPDVQAMKSVFSHTNLSKEEIDIKIIGLMGSCTYYFNRRFAIDKITDNDNFLVDNAEKIIEMMTIETMAGLVFKEKE